MNILHIDTSPRLESHSRALSAAIVEKLLEVVSAASITRRDIGADPLNPSTLPTSRNCLA
ncbi:NAD(P)H-dependent oxidoreductase [Rhizobium sp. NZLR8]|uniref:NAD(P)H-dependent oxidoreductase n=1 Tax=Rhizobium sp. NZLR8 TaxID=2731104 RepID=UPI002180D1DF|nr:NAD(P)H-dependent oxidoreductase [Rhizobium sp. NZLR8]